MRFGISLIGDDTQTWRDLLPLVEDLGFWATGVGDSQSIYDDAFVRLTLATELTTSVRLAPWVSNPVTRHPAVAAGAMATLQRLSAGRMLFGIGTGDSAVANLGQPAATVKRVEDYIGAMRGLWSNGAALWEGCTARCAVPGGPVPVFVAASGPRMLHLAGRVADGAIVGTGIDPAVVEESARHLDEGAAAADRDVPPAWFLVMGNLAETDEVAVGEIRNSLITFANLAFKSGLAGKHLPPEHEAAIRTVHERYNALEHAKYGDSDHARLADELGLTDYLRKRFALCGTPDSVLDQIRGLAALGCEHIWLSIRVPDKERVLRLWGDAVLPVLRSEGLLAR